MSLPAQNNPYADANGRPLPGQEVAWREWFDKASAEYEASRTAEDIKATEAAYAQLSERMAERRELIPVEE